MRESRRELRKLRTTLKSRRGAMARIASTLGVAPAFVSQVLSGRSVSARVMVEVQRVAQAIEEDTPR